MKTNFSKLAAKGNKWKLASIIILAALILTWAAGARAATTLTYASNGPEQSVRGFDEKLFLDEIEKQSEGRIKVNAFWADTLVSGNEILKAISDGVADMGFINANFYPKAMPYWNAIALNVLGPTTGKETVALYHELVEKVPALTEEFKRHKQFPAYFFATDCNSFSSGKLLNSLGQLKGMKARASSRWKLADFKALGATPVSVPWSECYMALQTGTVETILTSVESQYRGRLYEVAPYLWVWDKMWLGTPYIISMNINKFNKLSKEDQEAILRAGKIASEKFAAKFDSVTADELAAMQKSGVTVTHATDADYAEWMKLPTVEGNFQTWLEEAKASGMKDAEQNLNMIRQIVNSYLK